MPEEDELQDEIREMAREEALDVVESIPPVEFPEVQKVEVINFPEPEKVEIPPFPEQKAPVVNVPAPVVNVEPTPVNVDVEPPDLSALAEGFGDLSDKLTTMSEQLEKLDKPQSEFDFKKLEKIVKNNKTEYRGGGIGPSKKFIKNPDGKVAEFGGVVSSNNSTTETLGASATYTGTWEEITQYGSISIIASATQNATLFADFSTDGSTAIRNVQLSTGTDTSLGIHSLIPVAKFFRVRVIDAGSGSNAIVVQTIYHHNARIAQPTSRLGQNLSTYSDVLNTRTIIANTAGTNVGVTEHNALQVIPPAEGKAAFGEALTTGITAQTQLDFAYANVPLMVKTRANQSGSVTNANGLATVATGAAANSSGALLSNETTRYSPGHGTRARFTALFTTGVANSVQLAGLGDESNGFFFGYNGDTFGILFRTGGEPEIRTLTITTASSDAENITITLDGTAKTDVAVTNTANTTLTANEIAAADYSDVGPGWTAYAVGATVIFVAWDASSRTGTYSLSSATSAVGTFAQTNAGVAATDTWVAQTAWNGDDIFDGNGLTGETLDPTKGNVFSLDFQYLGFGAVKFFIEDPDTGDMHLVHTIQYSNTNTVPSLGIPHLPLFFQAKNTSNTSNLTVSSGSAASFTDGPLELIGPRRAASGNHAFGGANAEEPVLALRNHLVFNGLPNANKIKILEISYAAIISSGNAIIQVKLLKNPTLTDASFSDVDTGNSVAQTDIAATDISGGTLIAEETVVAGSNGRFESLDPNDLIIEPGDIVCISADPSANNATVYVSMRYLELF